MSDRRITSCAARLGATILLGLSIGGRLEGQDLTTTLVTNGLYRPTGVFSAPNDPRLFVTEQFSGRIRIVENGSILSPPFLDIGALIIDTGFEKGLLGLAFHADYANNGLFYVHYVDNSNNSVIAEYNVFATNPNLADPNSGRVVLSLPQPFDSHQGGQIQFGPIDGYLYIGFGDGGEHDPQNRAQRLDSLFGKILRIDVDNQDPGLAYAIPPSNPFVGVAGAREEVWHYGLRNPWRWSFDRDTGDMYIGDVGRNSWEEVSYAAHGTSGLNFGWRCMEGFNCTGLAGCTCSAPELTDPVHEFSHLEGCAVTGGFVYRGCAIPSLRGTYIFADFCSGKTWSFEMVGGVKTNFMERTAQLAPGGGLSISWVCTFGEDASGELYLIDITDGELFKIVPSVPPPDCNNNSSPDSCDIALGNSLDLNQNNIPDECESFSQDTPSLNVRDGGTATFTIDLGAAHAGRDYIILGSFTGSAPGIPFATFHVPLNPDPYFNLMASNPNSGPWSMSFGALDSNGRATASMSIPPFTFALGLRLWHAAVLVTPLLDTATNAMVIDFVL